MSNADVQSELHKLEQKLAQPHALESKDSAFAKELEHARKSMSPQEFAQVIREMQNDVHNCMSGQNQRELPVVDITWNRDGTVDTVSVKRELFAGELVDTVSLDSKGKVSQSERHQGIEANPTSDPISMVLTEWWTTPIQMAVDAYGQLAHPQRHRDPKGITTR